MEATQQIETLFIEADAGIEQQCRLLDSTLWADLPHENLGRVFADTALAHESKISLVTSSVTFTYGQLLAAAIEIRDRLWESPSFALGSRVLLLLPNSREYIAAYYGTMLAGGVAVPLAPKIERTQFESIRHSTAGRIVITQSRIAKGWTETFAKPINDPVEPLAIPVGLAAIMFTGGSSGTPKGVMLSHRNLIENAKSIQQYLEIDCEDRPLCLLPFYHAFGNSVLQSHILAGAQLVLDGNATFPETLVDAIAKYGATSLSGVPDLFRFLLERSSLGKTELPSLKYMAVAGGELPHELAIDVAAKIAPSKLFVMYGQTEATARLGFVPPQLLSELGRSCIGRPIPNVELEVFDESGTGVAPGVIGEIRARGPNIMLGYWQDAALTSETLRGGWLHTGDLGTVDDGGWIYHRGRRNALIKIAGYRIHPSDIEDFVTRNLPVEQAVLVPFELPALGTRLALYVRPKVNAVAFSAFEILARCRAELPRHMIPDEVQLLDSFPLNDAMKIDRPRLIEMAAAAAAQRRRIA
ncbi:MAG TPA: class I adenylate-forming enzyme family protein [Schlesneria sp.]